jgi:hypothetical protein
MLEEIKKSEILNHQKDLVREINQVLEERRRLLAKVSEA